MLWWVALGRDELLFFSRSAMLGYGKPQSPASQETFQNLFCLVLRKIFSCCFILITLHSIYKLLLGELTAFPYKDRRGTFIASTFPTCFFLHTSCIFPINLNQFYPNLFLNSLYFASLAIDIFSSMIFSNSLLFLYKEYYLQCVIIIHSITLPVFH